VDRWHVLIKKVESILVDYFGVQRLESWELCIWIREIAKSENSDEVRSPLWGQPLWNVSGVSISTFSRTRDQVFCPEIPKIMKRDKNFGESAFRVSAVEGSRNSEGEVAKSQIQSSEIMKGVIILFDRKI
jgi:hypothetical protein